MTRADWLHDRLVMEDFLSTPAYSVWTKHIQAAIDSTLGQWTSQPPGLSGSHSEYLRGYYQGLRESLNVPRTVIQRAKSEGA